MGWYLAKSLKTLKDQLNTAYPHRSKISDGYLGDRRHRRSKSDHNPNSKGAVRAGDFTHDPSNGLDCNKLATALTDSRDSRIKYLIWNRRICAGHKGPSPWRWRTYRGRNGHTKHLHISVNSPASYYDNSNKWDLDFTGAVIPMHDPELIEFGDKGFAVSELQQNLHKLGFLREKDIDGDFGPITKTAVETFQRESGLDVDGIVGKDTQRVIESAKAKQEILEVPPAEDRPVDMPSPEIADTPNTIANADTQESAPDVVDTQQPNTVTPDDSQTQPASILKTVQDKAEEGQGALERVGGLFQTGSRVSKSSWAVTIATGLLGLLSQVWAYVQENPIRTAVYVIAGVALIYIAVQYFGGSKDRDVKRKNGE